jgi:hypothetical protein
MAHTYLYPYEDVADRYEYHRYHIACKEVGKQKIKRPVRIIWPHFQAHFNVGSLGKERHELEKYCPWKG